MARESDTGSDLSENQGEEAAGGVREWISRYAVPIVVILVFAIAVMVTNAVDTSISGATIASVSSECQSKISDLEKENTELKSTMSSEKQALLAEKNELELEKSRLEGQLAKIDKTLYLYSLIVRHLDDEEEEVLTTPYGFEITWDKYIITGPNDEYIWAAKIKNTGSYVKGYSLDLRLKSVFNEAFHDEPTVGSLTLTPRNSGTLNVKIKPEYKGYGIFGIYVNGNYVGDLVVFSL